MLEGVGVAFYCVTESLSSESCDTTSSIRTSFVVIFQCHCHGHLTCFVLSAEFRILESRIHPRILSLERCRVLVLSQAELEVEPAFVGSATHSLLDQTVMEVVGVANILKINGIEGPTGAS